MASPSNRRAHYLRLSLPAAATPQRARLVERLLTVAEFRVETANWRGSVLRRAFGAGGEAISLANQLLAGETNCKAARGAWVFLASPLHTRASMTSVHLPPDGLLELDPESANRLAADFNGLFCDGGWCLTAGRSGRLYLLCDGVFEVRTFDPGLALGGEIGPWMARGAGARRLRAIGSEIEMWLFTHPVNLARKAAGAQPITALWPWGDGPLNLNPIPTPLRFEGADPLLAACIAGTAADPSTLLVQAPLEPGSASWGRFEHDWLLPAARELRAGRVADITLSCGSIEYTVRRFPRSIGWPRLRPWWQYFETD